MDALIFYAIAAGGIFTLFFLVRILVFLSNRTHLFTIPHQFLSPWTRAEVFLYITYIAINIFLDLLIDLPKDPPRDSWMATVLISAYIVMSLAKGPQFLLSKSRNLYTIIGAGSLGALTLLSLPLCRCWSYKVFLWGYQALVGLFDRLPGVLLAGRGAPRVILSYAYQGATKEGGDNGTMSAIRVWVGLGAWTQTHPFAVTLWSWGLSKDLLHHVQAVPDSLISFLALFSSPHGISKDVSYCKSALVVASSIRIAAVIPYVKKIIYGYNTCTSQVHHVHLVWQVESKDMAISAQEQLNQLLEDNTMDNGYILHISIYVARDLKCDKQQFGKHKRACLY
ncbi:hypothetical protein BJY00DRAFT_306461 [Aspergillus carlsbadensis]|nr:hypothetical protein BJY00DRAFT_306461 [Aspergillus carlsbadensis]